MKLLRLLRLWLLMLATVTSIGGCVIQHHPDGGITIRPIHVG